MVKHKDKPTIAVSLRLIRKMFLAVSKDRFLLGIIEMGTLRREDIVSIHQVVMSHELKVRSSGNFLLSQLARGNHQQVYGAGSADKLLEEAVPACACLLTASSEIIHKYNRVRGGQPRLNKLLRLDE